MHVCVYVYTQYIYIYIYIHTHTHIYIYVRCLLGVIFEVNDSSVAQNDAFNSYTHTHTYIYIYVRCLLEVIFEVNDSSVTQNDAFNFGLARRENVQYAQNLPHMYVCMFVCMQTKQMMSVLHHAYT